jgi:Rhodopirellula transposase DDE domain
MGRARYPQATRLLVTADCGGSNGARVRLWKRELQTLANELGIAITVCHLPPGTSKWNKIEHRLFSFITQNWRGRPLVSYQTIVQLIAATTTDAGLKVQCEIDANTYPAGVKVSDAEMDAINVERHQFHGDWNYTIRPQIRSGKSGATTLQPRDASARASKSKSRPLRVRPCAHTIVRVASIGPQSVKPTRVKPAGPSAATELCRGLSTAVRCEYQHEINVAPATI